MQTGSAFPSQTVELTRYATVGDQAVHGQSQRSGVPLEATPLQARDSLFDLPMLARYPRSTNWSIGLGVGIGLIGTYLAKYEAMPVVIIGSVCAAVGVVLLVRGCCLYAKGKGYSPWWGAIILVPVIGLFILGFLPDRRPSRAVH